MEDSCDTDYSNNLSVISSVARELEDLPESSLPAPIWRCGPKGALHIDMDTTPAVLIMGDSESRSREISTNIQE